MNPEQSTSPILLYCASDGSAQLDVRLAHESVWLSQAQMSELFGRERSVITKHVNQAFKEGELVKECNVQNLHIAGSDRPVAFYSLDVIISVGYRVKSQQGTQFRIWANKVLKQYLLQGYVLNEKKLEQLGVAVRLMKRLGNSLDAEQVLSVVESYTRSLAWLDDYDHQRLAHPQQLSLQKAVVITYEECLRFISGMSFSAESALFGLEKDDSFAGIIGAIYQSFAGRDLYTSREEKAANLLYLITKNHSFSDGNKRIAAAIFLYFLDRNGMLFGAGGEKTLDERALTALVILVAESKPEEKEVMVSLIMQFLLAHDDYS